MAGNDINCISIKKDEESNNWLTILFMKNKNMSFA